MAEPFVYWPCGVQGAPLIDELVDGTFTVQHDDGAFSDLERKDVAVLCAPLFESSNAPVSRCWQQPAEKERNGLLLAS